MSGVGYLQAPSTTFNELATILNHLPTHFNAVDVFLDFVKLNEFVELFDYPFDSHLNQCLTLNCSIPKTCL
jgi:hypothetical protein